MTSHLLEIKNQIKEFDKLKSEIQIIKEYVQQKADFKLASTGVEINFFFVRNGKVSQDYLMIKSLAVH